MECGMLSISVPKFMLFQVLTRDLFTLLQVKSRVEQLELVLTDDQVKDVTAKIKELADVRTQSMYVFLLRRKFSIRDFFPFHPGTTLTPYSEFVSCRNTSKVNFGANLSKLSRPPRNHLG